MRPEGLGPHHPFVSPEARERFTADYERLAAEFPLDWERSAMETDWGSTCVMSRGPADGPPVVMMTGAGGHSLQWPRGLIDALAARHRVHSVDNIVDFGGSASSRPIRKTGQCMSWLDEVLDALSPGAPVVLVGGSRGAWLSAEYTLHAPHRLAGTVWLSPALVVRGWSAGGVRFVLLSMKALRSKSLEDTDAMLRWLLPAYATTKPTEFDRLMVEHTALCFQCFDMSEVSRGWGPRRFRSSELRSIKVPVLYLAGADERLTSTSAAAERLERIAPHIEKAVLPRSGHDMLWVQTEEVVRRVVEFLGKTAARTQPASA